MIQFHLDECIPEHVAKNLRQFGYDCTRTPDVGLRGAKDEDQLKFCNQSKSVLITHDQDFLRLAKAGYKHKGIVYWTGKRSLSQMVRDIDDLCFRFKHEYFENQIFYL